MSNWQQTCEQQRNRLEKTEVLADKLLTLCNKAQSHLPPEILQEIRTERPRLERQLERLRANRFEVAVIGLEKAGKSALLNAWLGQEILPSEDRRCTYTTTEILSASNEKEQHLLIEYYTREEIDNLLQGKEEDLKKLTPSSKEYIISLNFMTMLRKVKKINLFYSTI
jgi:ribosome biogenesis GTPase A